MSPARALLATTLLIAGATGAAALETDQFWAWDRELADAADVVNARVNARIRGTLARLDDGDGRGCHAASRAVARDFRRFLFQELILWAAQSPLVETAPDGPDEQRRFRDEYLYHRTHFFDVGTKVPPSPTIRIGDVLLGTDKLSHFFSQGWRYHRTEWRRRRRGLDAAAAEAVAMRVGLRWEHTILGLVASGVLSPGDLEANYRGMLFYRSLCEGPAPRLARDDGGGWSLARPLDLRDYVTPEWDESWAVPLFRERRWAKVRPVMRQYCARRDDPSVVARHRRYAARDRQTPTERLLAERIDAGRLPDPARFRLEAVCAAEPSASAR